MLLFVTGAGFQIKAPCPVRVLLGDVVCELGAGLGGTDTNADGETRPLLNPIADEQAMIAYSDASRPVIPSQAGHPFRRMSATP